MKYAIMSILLLLISCIESYAQEKTIDRILDNTKGILEIIQSRKTNKEENRQDFEANVDVESSRSTSLSSKVCMFVVTNNSGKRITVTLKLINEHKPFSKQFVLSSGDKETFKNLVYGTYEYSAKFEDGVIAKCGEIELNMDNRIIEKEIK